MLNLASFVNHKLTEGKLKTEIEIYFNDENLLENFIAKGSVINLKAKILKQSTGFQNMPVSITLYSVAFYTNYSDFEFNHMQRMSFVHQVIITKKFNKNYSLALVPSIVTRT